MDKMIIFLISDFIMSLECTEFYDKKEDEEFRKDKEKLIDILEKYIKSIR